LLPVQAQEASLATPQGELIGSLSGRDPSIRVFRGIPYAAAPTGSRRWQPPADAPSWDGQRLATSFGPDCIQSPYATNSFFARPARPTSEDCLTLNVWTGAQPDARQPVMVWIHGGALTRGSGATPTYDGTHLARKGVVLVTINYRLGVFGYFAHPELIAESPENAAGNYGILDQIKALEWVQDNIAAFGGDPDNVTIFGESAGSWSVNFLTASPLAAGLFHKVIGESGGRLDPRRSLQQAAEDGSQLAAAIGADSLQALRDLPADTLLEAANNARFRTDGVVDGWSIPAQPFELYSRGEFNATPVLVGFNAEEGTTLGALQRIPENDDVHIARARQGYGQLASEFLELYAASDLRASTLGPARDAGFGWNMLTWARFASANQQPAYLYYFSHRPPGPNQDQLGAYHAAEIAYVFDNADTLRYEPTDADQRMANTMSNYWVNFARQGDPNGDGLPRWQPYSRAQPNYVELDGGAQPTSDLTPEVWDFFDRVWASRRR
jgi:para-nitrobenzyl esterase